MFKELFTEKTKPYYILILDKVPNKNELKDLKKAGPFEVKGKDLETTDKKVFNKLKEIADEIGLNYTPFVELMKESKNTIKSGGARALQGKKYDIYYELDGDESFIEVLDSETYEPVVDFYEGPEKEVKKILNKYKGK